VKASDVTSGAWTATWMRWAVDLIGDDAQWAAVVRTNPGDSTWALSKLVAASEGFTSSTDAVQWACRKLHDDGARVMVLGAPRPPRLEDLLEFTAMGQAQA
jgi:hypothetical protein